MLKLAFVSVKSVFTSHVQFLIRLIMQGLNSRTDIHSLSVRVCVCVCEGGKERETEEGQ